MDEVFSIECRNLISKSRDMAINLGNDYISTVHIFLADCETESPISIKQFAFVNEEDYLKFKAGCTSPHVNYLDHIDDSIPLTLEAESAIRMGNSERKAMGYKMTDSFHILIGCFKAENSVLANCFKNDTDVVAKLLKYYKDLGVIAAKQTAVKETKRTNLFEKLLDIFKIRMRRNIL